jgi:hypothetical protein
LLYAAVIGGGPGKSQEGKTWLDRVIRLPLLGPLFLRLELARLTRTLGALLKSGLPVLSAMEITQRVVQNSLIAQAISEIREAVQKGDSIADAVRTTGLFPPVVYHLLATALPVISNRRSSRSPRCGSEFSLPCILTSLLEPCPAMVRDRRLYRAGDSAAGLEINQAPKEASAMRKRDAGI